MSDQVQSSIIPFLRYRDATAAYQWLMDAFGFDSVDLTKGEDGSVAHAELGFGGSTIQISPAGDGPLAMRSPRDLPFTNAGVFVYVGDDAAVDAHFLRSTQAGAEVIYEPHDTFYGSRDYAVRDLEGHIWSFGTYHPSHSL